MCEKKSSAYGVSIPNFPCVLQDRSRTGKKRDWRGKKIGSVNLKESYERQGLLEKASKVSSCGSYLVFSECEGGCGRKLKQAHFCKERLCPMCAWRKSLVIFHQVNEIIHRALERKKLRFLFLTLTCRNIKGDQLESTLDKLFKAWDRLSKRKKIKDNVVGWFRALEITHDMNKGDYHPHFHVILAVKPSYFSHGYITQDEWVQMWEKSLRVDYTPIVDIRVAKPKRKGQGMESVVAETAKYAVKSNEIFDPANEAGTDRAVWTLNSALFNRRLVAFGGIFKEIRKELNQRDIEKADLVNVDEDGVPEGCHCDTCGGILEEVRYRWHIGLRNYVAECND